MVRIQGQNWVLYAIQKSKKEIYMKMVKGDKNNSIGSIFGEFFFW